MIEEPGARVLPVFGIAVLDLVEQAARTHVRGDGARNGSALRGILSAFDADEQRARRDAALQLLDQHALTRIRAFGQEGRKVGAELGSRDQRDTSQKRKQPDAEGERDLPPAGRRGMARHGLARTGVMFMIDRSPPTNSISTPSTSPPRPLMRTVRTCAARRSSMGSKSSVQLSRAPEIAMRK